MAWEKADLSFRTGAYWRFFSRILICPKRHSNYSESQIYEYIARVFIMSYSQHISDQMPRKNELDISIAFLHISELLIYLELEIKCSFLRIIKKLMTLQWYLDIFSQIVFSYLKLRTSQQLSFCAEQSWNHYSCHKFLNKFQDDISCTLVLFSFMRCAV